MKRYIDLDEAIGVVIDVSKDHAMEEDSDEAICMLANVAADTIFALMRLDRKEE